MTKRGHWYDRFTCPHREAGWHMQALKLVQAIEGMFSPRVASLMQMDLLDLLRANLPGTE